MGSFIENLHITRETTRVVSLHLSFTHSEEPKEKNYLTKNEKMEIKKCPLTYAIIIKGYDNKKRTMFSESDKRPSV